MKILRRHVGFTTNSSASSEWADLAAQYQAMAKDGIILTDSTTTSSTTVAATSETAENTASATTAATGSTTATTQPQTTQAPLSKQSHLWDNIGVIGGILLTVIGIFALERLIRRTLRKRAHNDDV